MRFTEGPSKRRVHFDNQTDRKRDADELMLMMRFLRRTVLHEVTSLMLHAVHFLVNWLMPLQEHRLTSQSAGEL